MIAKEFTILKERSPVEVWTSSPEGIDAIGQLNLFCWGMRGLSHKFNGAVGNALSYAQLAKLEAPVTDTGTRALADRVAASLAPAATLGTRLADLGYWRAPVFERCDARAWVTEAARSTPETGAPAALSVPIGERPLLVIADAHLVRRCLQILRDLAEDPGGCRSPALYARRLRAAARGAPASVALGVRIETGDAQGRARLVALTGAGGEVAGDPVAQMALHFCRLVARAHAGALVLVGKNPLRFELHLPPATP